MFVNYDYYVDDPDIWIEGIGSLGSFFLYPNVGYAAGDGPDFSLLCYFENNQLLYHQNLFETCDTNTVAGLNQINTPNTVQIFPNPVIENLIKVQLGEPSQANTTFQLFDVTGRMVLQKPLSTNLNRVELPDIAKGMYLYNIISGNEKIDSGKLVVQ